uniref:Uncharacterized protein n=1 Tax=Anguilla anguilla TaxID=7936 RepID=A0A0E9V3E7_ANGAN
MSHLLFYLLNWSFAPRSKMWFFFIFNAGSKKIEPRFRS